jgi:hypothetical protein
MNTIRLISLSGLLATSTAFAQVSFDTVGGTYSQNFNWTTGATDSVAWTNNAATQPATNWVSGASSLGWYAGSNSVSNATNFQVGNGNQAANAGIAVNNFYYTSGDTNRLLGGRPTAGGGPVVIAMRLTNNTGVTLDSFDLSYDLEVAGTRTQVTTRGVQSSVGYLLGTPTNWNSDASTAISGLGINFIPSEYATSEGSFTVINNPGNPNPGDFQTSASVSGQSFSWADGQDLWVRWTLTGDNSDFNVGIDNVSFVAIPEPGTLALVGIAMGALWAFRRCR